MISQDHQLLLRSLTDVAGTKGNERAETTRGAARRVE